MKLFRNLFFLSVLGGALSSVSLDGLSLSREGLRLWLLEMHLRQSELLKIDWGDTGLCTEWSRGYDPKTKMCGKGLARRTLYRRKHSKP